jgi:hypothetical protein
MQAEKARQKKAQQKGAQGADRAANICGAASADLGGYLDDIA